MVEQSSSAVQFESKLSDGRQRFLACAIEHALLVGRRSAKDFMRHFPPELIMEGMAEQPELRGVILAETTGLKAKIASKKSWQSAAEDLRIALSEGETNAEAVVAVFHAAIADPAFQLRIVIDRLDEPADLLVPGVHRAVLELVPDHEVLHVTLPFVPCGII